VPLEAAETPVPTVLAETPAPAETPVPRVLAETPAPAEVRAEDEDAARGAEDGGSAGEEPGTVRFHVAPPTRAGAGEGVPGPEEGHAPGRPGGQHHGDGASNVSDRISHCESDDAPAPCFEPSQSEAKASKDSSRSSNPPHTSTSRSTSGRQSHKDSLVRRFTAAFGLGKAKTSETKQPDALVGRRSRFF